jgi:hypothetical protein
MSKLSQVLAVTDEGAIELLVVGRAAGFTDEAVTVGAARKGPGADLSGAVAAGRKLFPDEKTSDPKASLETVFLEAAVTIFVAGNVSNPSNPPKSPNPPRP